MKRTAGLAITLLLTLWVLDRLFPPALPDQQEIFARVVTDRDGHPLRVFPDDQGVWRYPVPLEQVSPLYLQALLNYEDRAFWVHPGVNPFSLLRAVGQAIWFRKVVSGGSTLTMQVARLLHPNSRTVHGKLYQMARALQLEWRLSKQDILQIYLDIAPFGGTVEGVQAASFAYLNKPAIELTHAEAALLAVLPQSPSRIRPDRHPMRAQAARDKVLQRMADLNVWPQAVVDDGLLETVYASALQPPQSAPLLSATLVKRYPQQAVLHTTIDGALQRGLEDYVRRYRHQLPQHSSLALIVVDNRDSSVLAYVGSADFGNQERFGYLDMVQAQRSPGSTLKPFLYAMALEQGLIHSQSLLSDVPRNGRHYRPGNFNGGFTGPVAASDALRRSLNLPAVNLLERLGPSSFDGWLQRGGLNLSLPGKERPGLAMILGGAGTNMQQLVQGYSALAKSGKSGTLRFLQQAPQQDRFFMQPGSAWITWKMLSESPRPDQLLQAASVFGQRQVAWKTGTSYGFRDVWSIGVSKRHTVGVWVGRPDATPMPGHFGTDTAAPLMFDVFDQLPSEKAEPQQPYTVSREVICWPLGTLKRLTKPDFCEQTHQAWVLNQTVPATEFTGLNPFRFQVDIKSRRRVMAGCLSGVGVSESVRREVALWPRALEPWLDYSKRYAARVPDFDDRCRQASVVTPAPVIVGLEQGARLMPTGSARDSNQWPLVNLSVQGGSGTLNWFVNGRPVHRSKVNQRFQHRFDTIGRYEVVVVDEQGQLARRTFSVEGWPH